MKPRLVLLCGTARSGKDAFGAALREAMQRARCECMRFALADCVRLELYEITGVSIDAQNERRSAWRPVWQVWGTECRRKLFGENWWIDKWIAMTRLIRDDTSIYVPDVRFPNEFRWLKMFAIETNRDLEIVHVRRGLLWEARQLLRRSRWHQSERVWRPVLRTVKHRVVWNTGSLRDLELKAEGLVESWIV